MTIKKTFTFAIIHFSVAFFVTYFVTGSVVLGGLIAAIEPIVNTFAYFLHERIWNQYLNIKNATIG